MGRAAGQFRALVWKNWLCRLRTPVLSLAEFFWPCILFMILTVLRFQEPPRHRDDCYLQPRDLPSRGVFPFVRSLLCNTGSRCRSSSHAGTTERHFRFQAAAGRPEISDLDFLQEMQELAEDVYGVMGKAASLQALWAERSKSPDSSYGAGFLALDLNKTEEVISKLEQLHQQPHVWDLLRALPGLAAGAVPADDGVRSAVHLLRAVSKLLTSLEDLGWLPLDPAFARVSEIVLNATISTLTFLQECGAAATASSEASPCYEENVDWKVVSDNYFTFLNNVLKSPVASIPRVIGAIKELLTEKFHTSEDEPANSLLSFVEFLEKLLPTSFYLSSGPKFHDPPSLAETILNTSLLWTNHLKSSEREPSDTTDTWKHLEFGKEVNEKMQTLDKNESRYILRFMESILFKINPKLLELWTYDISEEERAKLEILSAVLNFSVPENERILSQSFNISQFFHSDWPKSSAVKMDFVHVSEAIISSLYKLGFLRQEQVSEALDTVYTAGNVSHLFSEPQKQEADTLSTHVSLNVFEDKDSALLLQMLSSFYRCIYKFSSIQSGEALLSFLSQISKHISVITKQFNAQDISQALAFLYETTEFLGGLSEASSCQQLLAVFNFLELRAQPWMSVGGPGWEVVLATLAGLRRLLSADEDFRVSLFWYMNQLFNSSGEGLLGSECFALDGNSVSFVNDSVDRGSTFHFQWAQILSNLSTNSSTFSEFSAVHCAMSCLQMWAEIWGGMAQILKTDTNVFAPLHVGLTRLLDELERDVNVSKSCRGLFPTHRPARLILDLLKNISQADGLHDWDNFLDLGDLWASEELVRVKSLNLGQIEKSLFALDAALRRQQAHPSDTRAGGRFSSSPLGVFAALSDAPKDVDGNACWINHLLPKNLTSYGVKFASIVTDLRETILFLRNMSLDQDLVSCVAVFQNATGFIPEEGSSYANPLQRTLWILAALKSTFSSEDSIRRLKGCARWVDTVNQLHVAYNPSFSQGRLQGIPRHFRDVENKINSTLKLVTWLLNVMEPDCSLNKSNINCVNRFLKNVSDFLHVILIAAFEKEKIPNSEILLTLLNDSTNHVRRIINNLTRDFEFASQSNWKHFIELILRPVEVSDEIPSQFQNIWLHLVALGKEIKKLAEDISLSILENNSSSKMEKFLNIFATSPKERDIGNLGKSFFHLASYLTFNLSHDLQNSPKIILHEVAKAVGLGVQVIKGVFDSLMPSTRSGSPEGSSRALKTVTGLLRALRKPDLDLLVDQLEQIGDSLVDFFRNVSGLGTGGSGVNLLIGLMEKLVDSSHSWDVGHLLRLSRLFPREDVSAVVDAYYVLPHAVRLLRGVVDKNITGTLQDVYDFTLRHGVRISGVTKEDFAAAIKALLDTVRLVSEKPGVLAEALTCLPVLWCRNLTTSGFQNPRSGACGRLDHTSSFYSNVASALDRLHLAPPGDVSQCSNESSQTELTRRMACVVHGLLDWSSIFLELFRVLHTETPLGKSVREFWRKVLPFVPDSGLCPSGPLKQVALQVIEKLKDVNFTEVTSDENVFGKLASLSKILNVNDTTEASVRGISVNLERIMKLLSGDQNLENSTQSLLSPLTTFLNADFTGRDLEALSSSMKSRAPYDLQKPWPDFEQITEDLNYDIKIRALNNDIQMMNSEALQNVTQQLVHFLESLNSSSAEALEITKGFLSVTKNWLCKYADGDYARMIQTLCLMANESSTDDLALLAKAITTFVGYLENIPREGDINNGLLSQLVDPEESTNFSVVQSLLESSLINSINNVAGSSQEAARTLSDSDLQIMNAINLPLNRTRSEGGEGITLPPGSRLRLVAQLLKTFFFLREQRPVNKTSQLGVVAEPSNVTAGENIAPGLGEEPGEAAMPRALGPRPSLEDDLEGLAALAEHWQRVSLTDASVADMCQGRGWRVKMLLLRTLLIFAENTSLAKDVVCAARSCPQGGLRQCVLCALHAATVLSDHFQELARAWSSPPEPRCVRLRGRLSSAWGRFRSGLVDAGQRGCECRPALDAVGRRVHRLAQSLEKTLFSGNPVLTFLSNFTVTAAVKVKDVMGNVTRLAEELRSFAHVSDETIGRVLEADISHAPVLWSALTAALSAGCDRETLRLLLAVPGPAARELCSLPGAGTYALVVTMARNLDLRSLVYKVLVPEDAKRVLSSLLDVVSGLGRLLPKAGRALELLPEFLRASEISALLDVAGAPQAPHGGREDSSAFGSFQSVMKMVCKEQEPFFSNSHTFLDLPRVGELLGGDRGKFHIPEDSTPFCLKLYQEILQSPNGALVWSFLKPILHGKILYTPDTPEINRVIQKANYTFYFVDKLKILSEMLLKISSVFLSGGNGQMLEQLQEALRNKFVRNFVESQLHIDVDKLADKLQTYGGTLGKLLGHAGAGRARWLGHTLVNLSSCVALNRFRPLPSVTVLEATARELLQQNSFLASVIFHSPAAGRSASAERPRLPAHVAYTLRTSVTYSVRTDVVRNPFWKFHPQSLPADGFKYNYVFVPLQDMIETAIVLEQTGWEAAGPAARVQAAPYPCHSSDLFLNNVGFFFPLIMVLTWMVSVASMVRKLVHEREIRLEEYLRVMGVHPSTSFLAWFAENVAVLAGGCAALAAVLRASGIFAHSDAVLVFLFLLDFAVSVVMLSYLLGACFGRADMAALCASLLYVVSFLPYIVLLVLHGRLGAAAQTLLCLLSTTAFGHGVFFITFLEGQEEGLQWANVGQAPEQVGMTFAGVCWMILFDSALYFLCGWYLSSLTPGTFGSRRPWHFPFAASYWKDVCGLVVGRRHALGPDLLVLSGVSGVEGSSPQNGPGKQDGGPPGVTLVSVTKEYEPHQAAVRDLTFTFHRDQITALLGTNGAGKSTVISMLTGLCPPTSGAILVDGRDLHAEPPAASRGLGVCLQQDVLLAGLTVREHLLLFASVKVPQWTRSDLRQQVDRTLGDVGLRPHQHTQTHALSGGLRRRLSIGIAFLGSSSTVVLDEPTSGVDTCSRRSIWDILLKYREGRTVIFTTHHLDEAEALSDCVAVLQQGGLRFCGPPAHLTAAYGQGLRLTLTRQPSDPGVDHAKDTARITALIQTHVPHAVLRGGGGRELSYALPRVADRTRFAGLFRALERDLRGLRLAGCGVSDSTLEEVFLMLLQDSKKQPDAAPGAGRVPQSPPTPEPTAGRDGASAEPPPARGARLLLGQVSALLARRFCRSRRAWKATLAHLLLPVLFVALAMALFMVRPLAVDLPPLKLSPGHYERHETYFFSESEDTGLARVLLRKFGDQDVLCADRHPDPTNSSSCWRVGPPPRPGDQGSCGCSTCPNGSAGVPYLANRLGHTLLNLSAFRLPEYLLVPSEKPRLGGWSFGERLPDAAPGANSSSSGPRLLAKVWYNQKGFHSLPSYLNHLNNLMLWRLLPPASDWRRYGITLYSHPYGGAFLNEDKILESIRQCGVALCIVLGFSILSASIGSSAVRDRVTGAKRLQHINGLGYGTYWFTNFLYDMLLHCVSVGLSVAVIAAFQLPAFTFRENLAATALLLLLFGYATLPWMYLTSRIFSSPDTAFIAYVSLNFIFGLCTMLMTTMPRLLAILSRAQNLQAIYDALRRAFAVFPQFCLGQGLIELCYNQITHDLGRGLGVDAYASPFGMGFLGWLFVLLAAQGTVLLLLRVLLHWDLAHWARARGAAPGAAPSWKDADVERERARVLRGGAGADVLVLRDLSKRYRGLRRGRAAVRGVSLGVARGECFGLLGANGAGKSTTFKMLSGDVAPTSGHAAVRTRSGDVVALSAAGSAGVRVGYCPQQDALDQLLTGWEHLRFYCSLRGVPEPRIPQVAGDLVRRLHLEAHVDKPVATYSGGTKRKLSTALALLGEPDLLLLDEPSSGMDPCSKRLLWQAIREEARRGCAVVLTTHSMEECEAVCTRLAIMVDGGFRCLGSPQHVKSRFGGGFTVRVWLRGRGGRPDAVSRALQLCAPGTQLKGQRLNLLEYHVPERSGRLADLFQVLETSKALLGIRHYSVNQTTLEQVFIGFATEQLQTAADPSADGCRAGPLPV